MDELLKVDVKPQGRSFNIGEPIIIRVSFTNMSIYPMRFPRMIDKFGQCFDIEFKSGSATIKNSDSEPHLLSAVSFPLGDEYYTMLGHREHFVCDYDIGNYFSKPGEFEFRVIFDATSGFGLVLKLELEWKNVEIHKFYSKWVKIKIADRTNKSDQK